MTSSTYTVTVAVELCILPPWSGRSLALTWERKIWNCWRNISRKTYNYYNWVWWKSFPIHRMCQCKYTSGLIQRECTISITTDNTISQRMTQTTISRLSSMYSHSNSSSYNMVLIYSGVIAWLIKDWWMLINIL